MIPSKYFRVRQVPEKFKQFVAVNPWNTEHIQVKLKDSLESRQFGPLPLNTNPHERWNQSTINGFPCISQWGNSKKNFHLLKVTTLRLSALVCISFCCCSTLNEQVEEGSQNFSRTWASVLAIKCHKDLYKISCSNSIARAVSFFWTSWSL